MTNAFPVPTFEMRLKRTGLNKSELARRMGVFPGTVSAWKDSPPRYVIAYLKLLIEYNKIAPVMAEEFWAEP